MPDFQFHRAPRAHQLKAFLATRDAPVHALFWEQRVGKSKLLIDTAAYLHEQRRIDTCIVVAQNGVHLNWVTDEIPKDWPPRLPMTSFAWNSSRAATKKYQAQLAALVASPGMLWVAINDDAMLTGSLHAFFRLLFAKRHVVLSIADESDEWLINPKSQRSKLAMLLRERCAYRRIATGTPAEKQGPLDYFSQMGFLDPHILGFTSYTAFKHHYAEWEPGFRSVDTARKYAATRRLIEMQIGGEFKGDDIKLLAQAHLRNVPVNDIKAFEAAKRDTFERLKERDGKPVFLHMTEFLARLAPVSSRVLRRDVRDAEEKVYGKRFFDMTKEQARIYAQLRDTYVAELSTGEKIAAPLALVRMMRLQQVSSGFFPGEMRWGDDPCPVCAGVEGADCDTCFGYGKALIQTPPKAIMPAKENPRAIALLKELDKISGKCIVWARFKHDYATLAQLLPKDDTVFYHGGADGDGKELAKRRFKAGDPRALGSGTEPLGSGIALRPARFLIGNSRAGGRGLDLSEADTTIYYSHDFGLRARLQSEDRMISLAHTHSKDVVDIVGNDTNDGYVIDALRAGKEIADAVTGDAPRAWL